MDKAEAVKELAESLERLRVILEEQDKLLVRFAGVFDTTAAVVKVIAAPDQEGCGVLTRQELVAVEAVLRFYVSGFIAPGEDHVRTALAKVQSAIRALGPPGISVTILEGE